MFCTNRSLTHFFPPFFQPYIFIFRLRNPFQRMIEWLDQTNCPSASLLQRDPQNKCFCKEIPLFSWLFRWNNCRTCSGSPETKGLLTYWLLRYDLMVRKNSTDRNFCLVLKFCCLLFTFYLLLPHFLTCKMGSKHYFNACFLWNIPNAIYLRTSGTKSWKESPTKEQKIHGTLPFFLLMSSIHCGQ